MNDQLHGWLRAAVLAACLSGCTSQRPFLSRNEPVSPAPAVEASDYKPEVPAVSAPNVSMDRHLLSDPSDTTGTGSNHETSEVATVSCEVDAPRQWTLESLEQLALANNSTLQQLSASVQKARSLRCQVEQKPNPFVGYAGSQLFDAGTDQHMAFVEQQFVTGDKLSWNRRVLDQSVQVQLWQLEAQRHRVLTDVRVLFYQALAAQRQLELTESFRELVERGVVVSQQRLKALEGSQVDVLQTEIQRSEIELKQRQAAISLQTTWKELAASVGIPQLVVAALDGDLKPQSLERNWDDVYVSLLASSPELNVARARVQEARMNQRRQEVQALPNPTMMVGAGPDNATGTGMLNVQVGVPLPVHNRNAGNVSAAWADFCRATHDVKRIEASLKARLAVAAREFDSAAATVMLYEEQILPRASDTLRLSEQAYEAGEFDFLQVLIVRRTYFESSLVHVQALGALAQADARLNGLLLTGGLDAPPEFNGDDALRQQALSQQ